MIECTLCNELSGLPSGSVDKRYNALIAGRQTVLARNSHFSVVPSIGALNQYHLMIVPNEHVPCLAALGVEAWSDMQDILWRIREFARINFGIEMMFFEHGAGCEVDTSGACIVHAHLHAVISFDAFKDMLERSVHIVRIPDINPVKSIANRKNGYILLINKSDEIFLANNPRLPSQHFRLLYSKIQNGPEVWNWRLDPRIDEVHKVIENFSSLSISN